MTLLRKSNCHAINRHDMTTKSAKHREGRNVAACVTLNALHKIRLHTSDEPFITVKEVSFQQVLETAEVQRRSALRVTTNSHSQ